MKFGLIRQNSKGKGVNDILYLNTTTGKIKSGNIDVSDDEYRTELEGNVFLAMKIKFDTNTVRWMLNEN